MQLVFNELSLASSEVELDFYQGEEILEQFIRTYSEAVKDTYGFDRSIVTSIDFNTLELTQEYNVSKWRNSPHVDRDLLRRFVSMCDRQSIVCHNQEESEIICEKGSGSGLLAAYENDAMSISFVYDPFWEQYNLECSYYSLLEDQNYAVNVFNISSSEQLKENCEHIQTMRNRQVAEIKTTKQLLASLKELYPSLVFHEAALTQLKNEVESQHVPTICNKLMMLEKYFLAWDGAQFDENAFPTKSVSPQSKETLQRFTKQHTYIFPDKPILASYHIRYTGNIPGRIYFDPDHTSRKGYVCSLTTKLPSVSDPKFKV